MAKYRLAIEKNNQITEIDWSSLLDKSYNISTYDLLTIDRLTTRFENSDDLKKFLHRNKILGDTRGSICIIYKSNKHNKKLIYGVSYKRDLEQLKLSGIFKYIYKKIEERDVDFIQKLINKYENSKIHANDIIILKNYIEAIQANTITKETEEHTQQIMQRFVVKEAYEYDNKNKRLAINSDGKYILKYRTLRELGKFCSNYLNKVEKTKNCVLDEEKKVMIIDRRQFPGQISIEEYLKEK